MTVGLSPKTPYGTLLKRDHFVAPFQSLSMYWFFLNIAQWAGGSHVSDRRRPTHVFNLFSQQETRQLHVTVFLECLLEEKRKKEKTAEGEDIVPF